MSSFQVTGPDGKSYRVDAPEGATQDDAIKFIANQHYGISGTPAPEYKPEKGTFVDENGDTISPDMHVWNRNTGVLNSTLGRNLVGVGQGMRQFAEGAGNMIGLGHVFPSIFGDENVEHNKVIDKLMEQATGTSGKVGEIEGQTLAALPLSEAAASASTALRAAPYVGKVLGSPLLRSSVEGAVNAAINANPNDRLESAAEGGIFGGALHLAGQGLGRTIQGLVQKSGAAQDLEDLAASQGKDVQIPLTQAADPEGDLLSRSVTSAYRSGLPFIPGVTGQYESQGRVATNKLKQALEDEYNQTVHAYQFNVPQNFKDEVSARIQSAMPNVDSTTLEKISQKAADHLTRFASSAADVDGENLLNAKNALLREGANEVEKTAARHGAEAFDDIIDRELTQGNAPQNLADLQRYMRLGLPDPQTGASLPQSLSNITSKPLTTPSTEGRLLLYGLGGYSAFAHGGVGIAPAFLGANALATKTMQRVMMGDTKAQQALNDVLEKHPEMVRKVGQILRLAGSSQIGKDNGGPNQ